MSNKKNRPDIDTLLGDRVRYEAWLAQLSAKASRMAPHVVDRVRADYQERLTRVVEDLRSRADDLRAENESLEQRISALAADLAVKRDARAEDELRAMVGEYEDAAWTKKAAEHDRAIESLESERLAREAELARVKELLAEATRPSRAMRAITAADIPEEPTPVDTTHSAAGNARGAAPEPVSSAPGAPQGKRPSPFDELGFLRTVVGRATPLGTPVHPEAAATAANAAPAAQTPMAAPVPPPPVAPPPAPAPLPPPPAPPVPAAAPARPSFTAPPPPPSPIASPPHHPAPAPAPAAPAPAVASAIAPPPPPLPAPAPRKSIPTFEPPPIPDAPVAAPARASAPAIPAPAESQGDMVTFGEPDDDERARNSQASRTLKCQECGWMNNPTEWYCEKCGGELAAF